ncbi:MAG TPA: SpoIID/LytB domain-containing protein [Gaiellaceae bacterium]|nr:SpoIID/LytB domain-containing protein [Gaiellaceae bacterium]
MRRLSLLVVLAAALTCASTAAAKTTFVVWGRGWGHGVGMSQWGAFGMASQGSDYKQILGHYYSGTSVEARPATSVSVLLASGRSAVWIGSASSFKVGTKTHDAGEARVRVTSTGRIKVEGLAGTFPSPLTIAPAGSPLTLGGNPYRGKLIVRVVSRHLWVVNRLSMESYLKGVVPRESPASWPIEALKAQAVAARSYAMTSGGKCGGYLCPDTRDQVYGGMSAEAASSNAAVDATAHEAVISGGSVAETFFYSSSGGKTATPKDGFGPGATNLSYLQSVDDPADLNSSNPNRFWQHVYTPGALGNGLGTGTPTDVTATRNVSGRADQVTVATGGGNTSLSGFTVRSRLGLRSTRFWVVVQKLDASSPRSACKKTVMLDVFVRGASKLVLERMPVTASSWSNVPLTTIDATHYRATQRPCVSTVYRVRTRYTARPVVGHLVFPDIGMNVNRAGTAMHGSVNPLLPGRTVTIQRHTASGWKAVASTTIRSDGTFRVAFNVIAGRYRARVVPPSGSGLVTGFSPILHVVTS